MRKFVKTVTIGSALVVGFAVVPALYAQHSRGSNRSPMQHGMMGGMGTMGQMNQMNQMMDHCNQMMGSSGSAKPNEQWRRRPPQQEPKTPEKKG